jgi:starch phosphorylase
MTALALRTSDFSNGVSKLHGDVTRTMWEPLLQERERNGQHPLTSITNGVHMPTWMSAEIAQLLDRYVGADWNERQDDPEFWNRVLEIPDTDLWNARQSLKRFLFAFIRQRARDRWAQENVSAAAVVAAGPLLDPGALTIGFARRFVFASHFSQASAKEWNRRVDWSQFRCGGSTEFVTNRMNARVHT